jgi:P27 family predicted phage terminase small subunit
MPTPVKRLPNMRKHLTKAEKAARSAAESSIEGKARVRITAPDWLSEGARKIFESTKRKLRGLDLLEPVDADLLALYADAVSRYHDSLYELIGPLVDPRSSTVAQAWSRLALSYAEKLGIGPNARARLAKKKAENNQPVDPMAALLGEVNDSLNEPEMNGDEQ